MTGCSNTGELELSMDAARAQELVVALPMAAVAAAVAADKA